MKPVKFPLNQLRGSGVTILGAIGECLPKGVFVLAPTTNREHVMDFFKKLRSVVTPNPMTPKVRQKKLVVVLDNHRAHYGLDVRNLASQLNMELLFLPPYCPELNSIESLWSIIKGRIKTQLISCSGRKITQKDFEKIMQDCCDQVTPAEQKKAARYNNRDYIHSKISEYLNPEVRSEIEARRSIQQNLRRETDLEEIKELSDESQFENSVDEGVLTPSDALGLQSQEASRSASIVLSPIPHQLDEWRPPSDYDSDQSVSRYLNP